MKAGAVIGSIVAVAAGLGVLVLVNGSDDSGRGVSVGVNEAEAEVCAEDSYKCLPKLTFVDTEGEAITSESLIGKVVMVNFWATWCRPCNIEIPHLSKAYAKYKDQGLELLGVMTDDVDNPALAAFSAKKGLKYPVVRVDYEIMEAFHYPPNLPTTYIYDRSGQLVFEKKGVLREADMDQILPGLLAAKPEQ